MAPTTIAASDVSLDAQADSVQRTFQRAVVFAMGRHWVFYVRAGVIPVLVYESSVGDSGVWSGETAMWPLSDGGEFSLHLQEVSPAQAFVHIAWADATGANPLNYVRGNLAAAGTIAWDAPQTVVALAAGWEYENIGITMSYGASPLLHIVYTRINIADPTLCTPWLTLSVTINGTWTTGAGYPTQLTAVDDPGWVPLVAPYGTEVITVYSAQNITAYSRLLTGGVLAAEVDIGINMGTDAQRMSLVSRRITAGGSFYADAAFLGYQADDWDLKCVTYELGWGAAVTIQSIGNFREANPLLCVMNYGDVDTTDHGLATLYCFWTPTADAPTAEWVTYRVSRDQNTTWTNEAGADAAEAWIDETGDGFQVQQSGSVYAFNSEDYDNDDARSYIGIAYVVHRMPPALRFAALGFADPVADLACSFEVGAIAEDENLLGEFVVRQSSPEDVGAPDLLGKFEVSQTNVELNLPAKFNALALNEELLGKFVVRQPASQDLAAHFEVNQAVQDLPGEFIVRGPASEELLGKFVVRRSDAEELLGVFVVRRSASQDLPAQFNISRDDWISQGLNISVYRDLGVVS